MDQATTYPGQRLGLPEHGSGSVASWLTRLAALIVDWLGCLGVATVLTGGRNWEAGSPDWVTPLVFLLETAALTWLAGGSFGQVAFRLAVARLDGRPVNPVQALGRSLLVLLVIPPLVFNRDNRGLHDLVFGTVVVRR